MDRLNITDEQFACISSKQDEFLEWFFAELAEEYQEILTTYIKEFAKKTETKRKTT